MPDKPKPEPPKETLWFGVRVYQSPSGMTQSITPVGNGPAPPSRRKKRSRNWMKRKEKPHDDG